VSLVVDESSVAVDSYAQAFRRQMEHCLVQTGDSGPRARRFELYPECYPEPVVEAHVLVKHVDRSDPQTNVIYEENWSGDRWTCRWDRHENPHNTRDHFHHPPSPGANDDPYAYDADLGRGVLLMDVPVQFVLARMNDLATSEQYTYPSNYEWTMEYQSDRYHHPDG
jgi:hypothetical protein